MSQTCFVSKVKNMEKDNEKIQESDIMLFSSIQGEAEKLLFHNLNE